MYTNDKQLTEQQQTGSVLVASDGYDGIVMPDYSNNNNNNTVYVIADVNDMPRENGDLQTPVDEHQQHQQHQHHLKSGSTGSIESSPSTSINTGENFDDAFELGELLGRGAFSAVFRCTHRRASEDFAVKLIDVARFTSIPGLTTDDLKREATISVKLKHPYIVELINTYASQTGELYMVYELVNGGDILFEIVQRATAGFVYSEAVASYYMRQAFDALAYCHAAGVIHRSIKPQCFMLASLENSSPIKLGGFGCAIQLPNNSGSSTLPSTSAAAAHNNSNNFNKSYAEGRIGAIHFMSPEMLHRRPYTTATDMWSIGVVLFIMLTGNMPFYGVKETLYEAIKHAKYAVTSKTWDFLSAEAKELLNRLLHANPNERITAEQALQHPWISAREQSSERKHLANAVDEMRRFNMRRQARNAILTQKPSSQWNFFYSDPIVEESSVRHEFNMDDPNTVSGAVGFVLNSLGQNDKHHQAALSSSDRALLTKVFEDTTMHVLLESIV